MPRLVPKRKRSHADEPESCMHSTTTPVYIHSAPLAVLRTERLKRRVMARDDPQIVARKAPQSSRRATPDSSPRSTTGTVTRRGSSRASNQIDGVSLTGGVACRDAPTKPAAGYKMCQSPGFGGFSGTPLFLGALSKSRADNDSVHSSDASEMAHLLPSATDVVKLFLSVSSHRTTRGGVISAWMEGSSLVEHSGRIRLLIALAFILLEEPNKRTDSSACPLTWWDIQYLFEARAALDADADASTEELRYLITVLLEEATQNDLTLKFRLENLLDFSDQITIRGWLDGGPASEGVHAEELRISYASSSGARVNHVDSAVATHPESSPWRPDIDAKTGGSFTPPRLNDPYAQWVVDWAFGLVEGTHSPDAILPIIPTPRFAGQSGFRDGEREVIVVDVQTDHMLRKHINRATELRKEFPNEHVFIQELRKYIHRRLHFVNSETKDDISKLAETQEGFVHIGNVRGGAMSRHFAILFKTLCDATGVYCRLVRDEKDTYYNVVMITDTGPIASAGSENKKESNTAVKGSALLVDPIEDEDFDEIPEELVPIFWEPTGGSESHALSHPLDILLQSCNRASSAVDLDEFFRFDSLIGKGSFGEVWKVEMKPQSKKRGGMGSHTTNRAILVPGKSAGAQFALKLIPPEEADKDEASFMRIYSHSRVVRVVAVFRGYQILENRKREREKKTAMCILMELADRCLESVLTSGGIPGCTNLSGQTGPIVSIPSEPLSLPYTFRVLADASRAMAYLHSPLGRRAHLVHRDLKPGNVLISKEGRAIITDFGVARVNPSLETNLTVGAGTEGYMAPEQKTLLYDRPADVYSFGVIIARMLGCLKWRDADKLTVDDFDISCDSFLVHLCIKCAQTSPLHRPSFDQIHRVLLAEIVKRELGRTMRSGVRGTPIAAFSCSGDSADELESSKIGTRTKSRRRPNAIRGTKSRK